MHPSRLLLLTSIFVDYVIRSPIENTETEALIKQALDRVGKPLGPWPGVVFDMNTDEGQALLGSPNGLGVGYLLIQHKNSLGMKTISKVTVFQDEGKLPWPRFPSMVFHVVDV
jgi:hypothetical protein